VAASDNLDPAAFRRWHLGTADVVHDWSDEAAAVSHVHTPRGHGLVVLAQPGAEQPRVVEAVDAALGRVRDLGISQLRLAVPQPVQEDVAARVGPASWSRWEWMHTRTPPPPSLARTQVRWLDDADLPDIASFLAEHSPRSHAVPGDADVRGWAGVRDADGLTCVGAVVESRAGFPHLRAITTRTSLRGRGLGGAVTSFLSAASLATHSVVTLSLYSDNPVARGLYERLGFTLGATFASTTLST
jgi:ribosomal protein S18 acetylase RimI-like enzyme